MRLGLPPLEELVEFINTRIINAANLDDCRIDSSLERFSGLNSAEELNRYRDQVLYSDGLSQAASVVEKVGSALGGLSSVPHAVGLGALVISLVLDVVAKSLNKETLGTAGMLERLFAQERKLMHDLPSGSVLCRSEMFENSTLAIRELMDEYMKSMQINLRDPQQQLSQTRQTEVALSAQLTLLKNSMMMEKCVDTHFLRQWLNGAAFHTQMLIHQARLERREEPDGSRAVLAAGTYQQELNHFVAKFINFTTNSIAPGLGYIFYASLFSKPQISWTRDYFSKLQTNIPTLVRQNAAFHIMMT